MQRDLAGGLASLCARCGSGRRASSFQLPSDSRRWRPAAAGLARLFYGKRRPIGHSRFCRATPLRSGVWRCCENLGRPNEQAW